MKPKRHDSQASPHNGSAAAPQARGEPDDLNAMWNAVASLLDNQTVSAQGAPAPVESWPAAPEPAASLHVQPAAAQQAPAQPPAAPEPEEIRWEMPSETEARAPFGSALMSSEPSASPDPASGDPFATAPYAYGSGQTAAEPPVTPGPTTTRDGQHTLPDAPGVGPQLLPAAEPTRPASAQPAAPQPPAAGAAPGPAWAPPAAFVPREPGSPFDMPVGLEFNSVNLVAREDGVAIEMGHGVWNDLLNLLSYRLEQSAGYFRNGHILVDVGSRSLTEPELGALRQVMLTYGMNPNVLRTSAERTFYSAIAVGLSAMQVAADGTPVTEAHRAVAEGSAQGYYIYRGNLRSGQVLYRPEHVVVVGDVNPGAEVVSDGDIMVWGRLRGIAHAGARGNTASIIAALDLDPVQLRIDTVIAAAQGGVSERGPRWGQARSQARRPEIARLSDGRLRIEAWDEVKQAGMPLFKRRRAN